MKPSKHSVSLSFGGLGGFGCSFYPPPLYFFKLEIKVIIFQYVNVLNKQPILNITGKYNL